jgi:hypothetical protein
MALGGAGAKIDFPIVGMATFAQTGGLFAI